MLTKSVCYCSRLRGSLPRADWEHLWSIARGGARGELAEPYTVLLAAVAEFVQGGCAGDDLVDTLTRLSHLWRTSVDQSGALLLSLVDFFRAQRLIVRAEAEALETLVYSGQDERLREGYLALQSGDERRCYEAIVEAAAAADSAELEWLASSAVQYATSFHKQGRLSAASLEYLIALARMWDDTLLAAVAVYEESGGPSSAVAAAEFLDTLARLGSNWIKWVSSAHRSVLRILQSLANKGVLRESVRQTLELLVLRDDPVLLAAYALYAEQKFTRLAWLDFWDTLKHLIQRYHLPVDEADSIALETDLAPDAEQLLRCVQAVIEALDGDGADTLIARAKAGDVVLEAAFITFRDTGNVEEFLDTCSHMLMRAPSTA